AAVIDVLSTEGLPTALVISAMPPDAVVAARYLCRRVRARFAQLPILVGLWQAQGNGQIAVERLESAGADAIVIDFAECLAELERLTEARSSRQHQTARMPGKVQA